MEHTTVAAAPRTERNGHGPQSASPARQRSAPADAGAGFGALLDALSCDPFAEPGALLVVAEAELPQELTGSAPVVAADLIPVAVEAVRAPLPDAATPDGASDADASSTTARIAVLLQGAAAQAPVSASGPGQPTPAESGPGRPAGVAARALEPGVRRDGNMATMRATERPDLLAQPATSFTPAVLPDQSTPSAALDATAAEAARNGARASTVLNRRTEQQRQREASVAQPVTTLDEAELKVANAATLLLDGLGGGARILTSGREPERKTPPAGGVTGPTWMEAPALGGPSLTSPSFVLDAGVAAPEVTVAERVHYWVTKGVQNAALQLDAFGGGQVDVHVSVVGNEAQVEFRTDQPEARRLLQDAMPQLRQMLAQEGMLLSGGFVGTSTRQDPGSNGRQPAQAPEGAKIPAGVALPAVGQSTGGRGSGSTLDVFV